MSLHSVLTLGVIAPWFTFVPSSTSSLAWFPHTRPPLAAPDSGQSCPSGQKQPLRRSRWRSHLPPSPSASAEPSTGISSLYCLPTSPCHTPPQATSSRRKGLPPSGAVYSRGGASSQRGCWAIKSRGACPGWDLPCLRGWSHRHCELPASAARPGACARGESNRAGSCPPAQRAQAGALLQVPGEDTLHPRLGHCQGMGGQNPAPEGADHLVDGNEAEGMPSGRPGVQPQLSRTCHGPPATQLPRDLSLCSWLRPS